LFKTWLGQTVGKDDLTRHDKWLCMMTPRLKLLRELLSDDGAIFISIDDNEQYRLRLLMDEVFGEEKFVGQLVVVNNKKGRNDKKNFSQCHEYILIYANPLFNANGLFLSEKQKAKFDLVDEQGNRYQLRDLRKRGRPDRREDRPNMYFPIYYNEKTKECSLESHKNWIEIFPLRGDGSDGRWRWGKEKVEANLNILEPKYSEIAQRWGIEHRIYLNFLSPFSSQYEERTSKSKSFWNNPKLSTDVGRREFKKLVIKKEFDYPKSVEHIKRIIQIGSDRNSIILDSFAGSGTTMHAVMDLNKEDGGNRTCIMVQMTEASKVEPKKNICKDITRERIKRAIDKYQYKDGFRYLKVGIAIDAETMLSGSLPAWKQFAEYVYYLCTGTHLKNKKEMDEKSGYVGTSGAAAIYLVYKKDREALSKMAVCLDSAKAMIAANPEKRIIVYAPACFLEESFMREHNIELVGIPYDLFRRTEVR
jgi:adenine-specific DNA-methyltransferase